MKDEVLMVGEAMRKYGGGFVRALGIALQQADSENTQKIKDTWADYWAKYKEIAEKKKGGKQ
jgi:hypothetical protein